jgi:spore coat polysaccharide biosynthesis predicted glycosyltransferase SpsG
MRYVFRADASQSIGAGHVMRSTAIAEELIARGKDVVFVGEISELPWVKERITTLGFTDVFTETSDYLSSPKSDVLLLDTYLIDIDDAFISPENWLHVIVIVDELTPNYRCTLRIHPGVDSDWVGNALIPTLAGPKYIPIRSSLSKKKQISNDMERSLRIAVVAGGSDPYGLVHEIANILVKIPVQFEVSLFSVSDLDSTLDSRFKYIEIGQRLDDLTMDVDLVITTASTSSLEFLARGLCVGLVCAVDNQRQYYNSLGKLGVAAQLGFRTLDNSWELDEQKIYSLISSTELRMNLMTKAVGLVDFSGASRIVDVITTL